ncbi:hypothetical protein E1H12_21170 [Geitlerinema sp. P-1104]|uniref:hypothetical protein n=1 Tax=Geitlerinema sp. P-1104 TaxID=2546230 RepID=UPI001476FCAA|nr:hypothetical protein [Geitlerinema sp. P-1104]NMG60950.1 hypothetical protein [Geitlerinema sp. P-1104]
MCNAPQRFWFDSPIETAQDSMTSQFTSNLNPDEIKDLISQLCADNVSDLKTGLENWLDTSNSPPLEETSLHVAHRESCDVEERF